MVMLPFTLVMCFRLHTARACAKTAAFERACLASCQVLDEALLRTLRSDIQRHIHNAFSSPLCVNLRVISALDDSATQNSACHKVQTEIFAYSRL
jgi:hypothetical protein